MGLDSSPEMIEAALKRLPTISFEIDDISTWRSPGAFDVILSNAALQWVPDHAALLPRLLAKLAPAGSLAVQVPDSLDEPPHRLMREVAAGGAWAAELAAAPRVLDTRHGAEWYFRLLRDEGAIVNVWRTTYFHQLPGGAAAIVDGEALVGVVTDPNRIAADAIHAGECSQACWFSALADDGDVGLQPKRRIELAINRHAAIPCDQAHNGFRLTEKLRGYRRRRKTSKPRNRTTALILTCGRQETPSVAFGRFPSPRAGATGSVLRKRLASVTS